MNDLRSPKDLILEARALVSIVQEDLALRIEAWRRGGAEAHAVKAEAVRKHLANALTSLDAAVSRADNS